MLKNILILTLLLMFFMQFFMYCSPKSKLTKYTSDSDNGETKTKIDDIIVKFSTLDSIKPYVHEFPTGYSTVAPKLDRRNFYHPDSLIQRYLEFAEKNIDIDSLYMPLDNEFNIIGYISVDIEAIASPGRTAYYKKEKLNEKAKNLKPYFILKKRPNDSEFNELLRQASEIGADAIIEIFCGENVDSLRFPTKKILFPAPWPNEITGGYIVDIPTEKSSSGWTLMGLAIRFKE